MTNIAIAKVQKTDAIRLHFLSKLWQLHRVCLRNCEPHNIYHNCVMSLRNCGIAA